MKPKNVGDVWKLVGFVSHFRRYFEKFRMPSHLKGQQQKSKSGQLGIK